LDDISEVSFNKKIQVYDRLSELHTLKGYIESTVKMKGLDIDAIQKYYIV